MSGRGFAHHQVDALQQPPGDDDAIAPSMPDPVVDENGRRVWVEKLSMATDNGTHFPIVGQRYADQGQVCNGKVGNADALLFSTRALVDFAQDYFREVLR